MIQDMMEISQSSQQEETHEENNFPAQRDSDEDVDVLEHYMTQEQERQASGFIGKSSELRLLRQLHLKAGDNRGDPFEHQNPYPGSSASMEAVLHHNQSGERHQRHRPVNPKDTNVWSFYLDNCDLHPDLSVQAFELPLRQTAERLVNSYLTTVQPTFPILAEPPFKTEFDQLYATSSNSSNTTNRWLGILNLVFAIGRRHQDLAEDIRPPDDSEHQVYWSRAHVLGLELFHSVEYADTTQLQASGLLAMYLLSVGHVNRWDAFLICVFLLIMRLQSLDSQWVFSKACACARSTCKKRESNRKRHPERSGAANVVGCVFSRRTPQYHCWSATLCQRKPLFCIPTIIPIHGSVVR